MTYKYYYNTQYIQSKLYYEAYVNNGGGNGGDPNNKYQKFITSINKQLLLGGIPLANVNKTAYDIQTMINQLKQEDINYLNNDYYIAMKVLLKDLDVEYKIKLLKEDILCLANQVASLTEENVKLKTCCNDNKMYTPGEQHGIVANCAFKMEYIIYIQRYGVPEDGIFLPSLLSEIIIELGL